MLKRIEILLTEDQKIHQAIFVEMLQGSGIHIDIANNGKEAIKKSHEKSYALILMDIDMPIMDGYEATKIIRNHNKEIPILAFTSHNTREAMLKTEAIGMNEHLVKPIETELLYQSLSKYLNIKEAV
ncbi:MAG TPA: response regulator [Campylobacterales bacterium]|nr:response regulator [Campylobacterales bacterium]